MANKKLQIWGLTGIIGSGKSKVASMLEKLGAAVIDADVLAREVVEKGTPGLTQIIKSFGADILLEDDTLDRKKLGTIIFQDGSKRKLLEEILHPLIRARFLEHLEILKANNDLCLIVAVIPLLFESKNSYPELDKILVVAASPETCIQRIIARDNCSQTVAENKLKSQMPISEKIKRADIVLENDGTIAELELQVRDLVKGVLIAP